jgi:hypothetical protein
MLPSHARHATPWLRRCRRLPLPLTPPRHDFALCAPPRRDGPLPADAATPLRHERCAGIHAAMIAAIAATAARSALIFFFASRWLMRFRQTPHYLSRISRFSFHLLALIDVAHFGAAPRRCHSAPIAFFDAFRLRHFAAGFRAILLAIFSLRFRRFRWLFRLRRRQMLTLFSLSLARLMPFRL